MTRRSRPANNRSAASRRNIRKDTGKDNHGLPNAKSRIEDNMQDRADRKAADRDGKKRKQHDADEKTKHEKLSTQPRATGQNVPNILDRGGRP